MTLREALQEGTRTLLHGSVRTLNPRLDAETLLLHALKRRGDRAYLFAHGEDEIAAIDAETFRRTVEERSAGKPVQYITGHQEFWGLDLEVSPAVLIPRPETELVVEQALRLMPASATVLDVGTGSGCIAIAIAHSRPEAKVAATDISPEALTVARRNAERLHAKVEFLVGDLCAPVAGRRFDIIVSNPPYIAEDQKGEVEVQVKRFEPSAAPWAGEDGLEVYRRLIPQARAGLVRGGWLVMEIGYGMADAVSGVLGHFGWSEVQVVADLQGIPRVVICRNAG